MEMNTRIQVEHPVTELVTGIDLVRDQILIAAGDRLPQSPQEDIQWMARPRDGVSHQCRRSRNGHRPSPGKITTVGNAPGGPGVRVDTAAYAEYVIPPYYDSLIAKLVVHAATGAWKPFIEWSALSTCLWSKEYLRRFRCIGVFWPTRIFARASLIRRLSSGSWRRMGKRSISLRARCLFVTVGHPERSGRCAKRSGHAVEGPVERAYRLNAARHSHNILAEQNSLARLRENELHRGPLTALTPLRNANSAQDDWLVGTSSTTRPFQHGSQL